MSKKRKEKASRNCQNCANCIYICEGDFYCDETWDIVLTDFTTPTKDYLKCKGKGWESND